VQFGNRIQRNQVYLVRLKMVGLGRFELPTHGLGNRCSILLSYRPTPEKVSGRPRTAYHRELKRVHIRRTLFCGGVVRMQASAALRGAGWSQTGSRRHRIQRHAGPSHSSPHTSLHAHGGFSSADPQLNRFSRLRRSGQTDASHLHSDCPGSRLGPSSPVSPRLVHPTRVALHCRRPFCQ
jgi:hypothetical protein